MGCSNVRGTVIVANGPITDIERLRDALDKAVFTVAVDGGGNTVASLGFLPDALLGDFDSISLDNLNYFMKNGVKLVKYESEKDETDLQLALDFCLERGCTTADVFGALGGRVDHLISNISLLAHYMYKGIDCFYLDGATQVCTVIRERTFEGCIGDILSLSPVGYRVSGIMTTGLKYPLNNGILTQGVSPIGVSNVFIETQAAVSVAEGELLAVHIKR